MADRIPKVIPMHLDGKNPKDVKLYNALKKASFDKIGLSMAEILRSSATKELKRKGYLKK